MPFELWINQLKDRRAKAKILVRLDRIANGNYGNYGDMESVSNGVSELRIKEGKGYRVYFARDGDSVVILLCGGDKSSQLGDIKQAMKYWREYNG